jgi:hypothetical protein
VVEGAKLQNQLQNTGKEKIFPSLITEAYGPASLACWGFFGRCGAWDITGQENKLELIYFE